MLVFLIFTYKNKYMSSCPENVSPQTCGLAAAEFLIDRAAHGYSYIVLEPYEKDAPIKIDVKGTSVMEVLDLKDVKGDGFYDIATFGCVACDKCVEVIDDDADLSARIVEK
jgi:hypothetical protein